MSAKSKEDIAATALRIGTPVTFGERTDKSPSDDEDPVAFKMALERAGLICAAHGDGLYNVVYFGTNGGVHFAENVKQEQDFRLL